MKIRTIITVFLLFLANIAFAKDVLIVHYDAGGDYLNHLKATIAANPGPKPTLSLLNLSNPKTKENYLEDFNQADLIVTAGFKATNLVLSKHPKAKVLSTLIHKHSYIGLCNEYYPDKDCNNLPNFSAIYIDEPIKRSFNLVRAIVPKNEKIGTIGVLVGPASSSEIDLIQSHAIDSGVSVKIAKVEADENPITSLNYLLSSSKFILAIADPFIYNKETARGIVISALRKDTALIAFSNAYVEMGALACVYATPKQLALQTAATILLFDNLNQLPSPAYPEDFSVAVNEQVAQNFNFNNLSATDLKYTLLDKELP